MNLVGVLICLWCVGRVSGQIESAMRKVHTVKGLCESSLHRQKELEVTLEDVSRMYMFWWCVC